MTYYSVVLKAEIDEYVSADSREEAVRRVTKEYERIGEGRIRILETIHVGLVGQNDDEE